MIAHEMGHHVQNLLGIDGRVRAAQEAQPVPGQRTVGEARAAGRLPGRRVGVRRIPAGASREGKIELEAGDVEEGLRAAAAIGDDRIQRMSTGRVFPEKFTHGSSAQRKEWFNRGLTTGRAESCRAFGTEF